MILKPSGLCDLLSASGVLMLCLSFLYINLFTDKNWYCLFLRGRTTLRSLRKYTCTCSNACVSLQSLGKNVSSWSWNICFFRFFLPFIKVMGIPYIYSAHFIKCTVISQFIIKLFYLYLMKVGMDGNTKITWYLLDLIRSHDLLSCQTSLLSFPFCHIECSFTRL